MQNPPPLVAWALVGSFHAGLPDWKDKDTLILSHDTGATRAWLEIGGWVDGAADFSRTDYRGASFISMRHGEFNAIILHLDSEFYGFLAAFYLCKKYKVTDKSDRVLIHESLRARAFTPGEFHHDQKTLEVTCLRAGHKDA